MSVTSSNVSKGLSPDLIARYSSAIQKFVATSTALASAGPSDSTRNTEIQRKDELARCTSNGLKKISDEQSDLFERLARLATTEPPAGRPPLETYTTTPTAHGDIFRATHEFRSWIRSRYRGYGVGDYAAVQAPGPAPKAVGGLTDDDF